MFGGQAQQKLVQEPDERMRRNTVVGGLGDDDERAAAPRIAQSEFAERHRGVAMPEQIDALQFQAVEHLAQFFRALRKVDGDGARLSATIQDDAPRLAQSADLASVDELKMFENGHEDQWFSGTNIDQWQIQPADWPALPERFEIPDIIMEGSIIDQRFHIS